MSYSASFNDSDRFEPDSYLTDYFTNEAVKAVAANKTSRFSSIWHIGAFTLPYRQPDRILKRRGQFPQSPHPRLCGMIRAVDRSVGRVVQALKDNGIDDNTLIIFTSDNGGANYIGVPDINNPIADGS